MLEEFLGREKVAPIYHKGWVDLMIDTQRDKGGQALNDKLKRNRSGGLPWLVILDTEGKELVTSNAKDGGGNIGSPVSKAECAWFLEMLSQTQSKTGEDELAVLASELEKHASKHRRR